MTLIYTKRLETQILAHAKLIADECHLKIIVHDPSSHIKYGISRKSGYWIGGHMENPYVLNYNTIEEVKSHLIAYRLGHEQSTKEKELLG